MRMQPIVLRMPKHQMYLEKQKIIRLIDTQHNKPCMMEQVLNIEIDIVIGLSVAILVVRSMMHMQSHKHKNNNTNNH